MPGASPVVGYKKKRLFWDIETSLILGTYFQLKTQYNSPQGVLEDWYIICIGYKWEHSKSVEVLIADGKNDKEIVIKICELFDKADEIIHHNGDKFDMKKLNTRVLYHGLPPLPKYNTVDTLKQARKHFGFTSNSLDYLSTYLGLGEKISTGFSLWMRVLKGDKAAVKEMAVYCKHDVLLLEKVFNKMVAYIDYGVNYNLLSGVGTRCPTCGSDDLMKRGFSANKAGKYQKYVCNSCGKWCSAGNREKRDYGINPLR